MPNGVVFRTTPTTATNATDVVNTVTIPEKYHDGTYAVVGYGAYYTGTDVNATFVTLWLETQETNTFPDPEGFPLGDFILRSMQPGTGTTPPSYGARHFATWIPLPMSGGLRTTLRMSLFNQDGSTPVVRGFIVLQRWAK